MTPSLSNTDLAQWTIRWQPYTRGGVGGYRLGGHEPWPGEEPVPVIPCDDDAIERMAQCLYDSDDERVRVDGVEWANEPDGYRGLYRDRVRELLMAARRPA